MKTRIVLLAAVLAGGFVYLTSVGSWNLRDLINPIERTGRLWTAPDTAHSAGFSADEQNNIDIYKMASEATVNITSVVYRQDWFFQVYPERGQGSGFLIDADGRILTNRHVVSGRAPEIVVTLADKSQYKATLLGRDSRNDLALIKIEPKQKLPFLKLGDSDAVKVGQKVLAIGNPFGFEGTLTVGVVSAVERSIRTEEATLEGMIQTDAAINPGNSGGPLLDARGNAIGINTMIYGSQGNIGIGFAMPISRAISMLDEFQQRGRIARPLLGISVLPVQGDFAEALELPRDGGLLISEVQRNSPADKAGLRGATEVVIVGNYRVPVGGDLIVAIDNAPARDRDSLQRALNRKRAGDPMDLTVYRGGRTQKIRVVLGEAPEGI